MYYFHGNCRKCTEKIVGDLVREGKTRFIIYGFGDAGMKVKSILNVCMGIQEHLVVDDSHEGLPERWTSDPEGMYSAGGVLPDVKPNVQLIRGWFEETLPRFLKEHGEKCSFIHIDCDLYSSAKTVLSELRERIVPGTVIVFDEYFNYPGWQQYEYRAFQEFTEESGTAYEYIGYCRNGQHAAVRITEVRK